MLIPIQTSEDKIFRQYLIIINGLLSSEKRLTNIEIDILDKMLYIDYLYRDLPKDKRDIIIFDKRTKDKIRGEVYGISQNSFNNALLKLRRKGMINMNSLKVKVPIDKNGVIDLTFKLEIK